jgi:hypothetical protein
MRSTLNIQHSSAADLARALRSAAAKIELGDIVPGADITVGNVRVQVATPQESPIRAFARANGFEVGSRGRYSKALQEAYAAHEKAERKAKRDAAAARRAEKALVSA